MKRLEYLLSLVSTEESKRQLLEAVELVRDLGVRSIEDDIELVLNNPDIEEVEQMQLEIFSIVHNYLHDVCKSFMITTRSDASLEVKVKIASALHALPNYGNMVRISEILEKEDSATILLSDVISTIEDVSWGEVSEAIDNTSLLLIDRIRDLVEKELDDFEPSENNDSKMNMFKSFLDKHDVSLYKEVFRKGIRLGSPLDVILETVYGQLEELVLLPELFSKELVSLVIISSVEADFKRVSVDVVEDMVEDINNLSKISKSVSLLET